MNPSEAGYVHYVDFSAYRGHQFLAIGFKVNAAGDEYLEIGEEIAYFLAR
jgi:hypothetical protein